MIFAPLPGEYVASAIRRGNETLGIKGIKKADYHIKKKPRERDKYHEDGIIEYPSLFEEHRVTDEVINENTLYPLAAALGRTQASCIYTPTRLWKICLHCAIEDLEVHGTIYIHRRNVLASVSVCSTHASKLHDRCPTCQKTITIHTIKELAKCSESFKKTVLATDSVRHLYAKFASDLLGYNNKSFTPHHVETMIYMKLRLTGQIDKNSTERLNSEIKIQLGINIRSQWFGHLPLDFCAASAFLAYQRADDYLTEMNDSSAWKALHKEVSELEIMSLENQIHARG